MQESLHEFWEVLTQPLLEAAESTIIVEIGAAQGRHTKDLLHYCEEHNGELHVIDPEPAFHEESWTDVPIDHLRMYRDMSLNALPKIQHCDTVIIDGDHNWYTVYHELLLIEKQAKNAGSFPLILLHDTGWPYGRRDLYTNPDRIPAAYRKSYAQRGLSPEDGLCDGNIEGLNPDAFNALEEHSLQSGVLTAVEDFIEQSKTPMHLTTLPGFFGFSILTSHARLKKQKSLGSFLKQLKAHSMLTSYMEALERARIDLVLQTQSLERRVCNQREVIEQHRSIEESSLKENARLNRQLLDAERSVQERKEYCLSLKQHLEEKERELESVQAAYRLTKEELSALQSIQRSVKEYEDALLDAQHNVGQLQQQLHDAQQTFEAKITTAENELHTARSALERERERSDVELATLQTHAHTLQQHLDNKTEECAALGSTLAHMQETKSWRWTAPLRWFIQDRRSAHLTPEVHEFLDQNDAPLAACTIISKNYLPQARVLAKSFLEHHPGSQFFVLLVDRLDGEFDPSNEPFTLVTIDELPIQKREQVYFQYICRELNTVAKPPFLQWIFQHYPVEKLAYIDPDIEVFAPLTSVSDALQSASIVLTPHILHPIEDNSIEPSEVDTLRVGACNLGFIALRRSDTVDRMLSWWEDRLIDHCFEKPEEGLFFDQKWIDLVPSLFGDTHILRDDTLNVAFWNLQERSVGWDGTQYTVNSEPLTFYHFSGFRPEDPGRICLYHNSNHTFSQHQGLKQLFKHYVERLHEEGYETCRHWEYAFSSFASGTLVTTEIRRCYNSLGNKRASFGDPFAVAESGNFFDWLNACAVELSPNAYLSNLHVYLRDSRLDLRTAFPDLHGEDGARFAHWLLEPAQREAYKLDDVFYESLQNIDSSASHKHDGIVNTLLRKRNSFSLYRFGVSLAKKFLPTHVNGAVRGKLQQEDLKAMQKPPKDQRQNVVQDHGINFVGYFTSENGIGQAARLHSAAARVSGIPHSIENFTVSEAEKSDQHIASVPIDDFPYDTNLIHINADQVPVFLREGQASALENRYNIGYWLWELPSFPEQWHGCFEHFNEIWTASDFTTAAVAQSAPIPVITMPLPILIATSNENMREELGIPEDRTVFLFMFDYMSVFERKNPIAVIEAFRHAFDRTDNVTLVLKTTNAHFDARSAERLERYATSHPSILLIQEHYTLEQTHALIDACDVYVSLHRSEGFGLSIAEAMHLGKPVIATDYSANTDYMNIGNSFPVRCSLVELDQDYGPYRKGNVWADPDIGHAASLMRYVYENPVQARSVGKRAAHDVQLGLSPRRIGERMKGRLEGVRGTYYGVRERIGASSW